MPHSGTTWVVPTSAKYADNIPFPIKMIIFFASNPEIELSAKEIAIKWGMDRPSARSRARKLERQGFLSSDLRRQGVPQKSSFYRAGPVIRAELGYED